MSKKVVVVSIAVMAMIVMAMFSGCINKAPTEPEGKYFLEEPNKDNYIYIDLNPNGTYVITAEELEGDCFFDGAWKQTGNRIEFIDKSGRSSEHWDYCDCIFTKNTLSCEEAGWFTNRDDLPEQWIKQGAVAPKEKKKTEKTYNDKGLKDRYVLQMSEDGEELLEILELKEDGTFIFSNSWDSDTVVGTWRQGENEICLFAHGEELCCPLIGNVLILEEEQFIKE
jgi:hypothetical protein